MREKLIEKYKKQFDGMSSMFGSQGFPQTAKGLDFQT